MNKKTASAKPDDSAKDATPPAFPIIGIGASAGGVAALQTFVTNIADDSGFAYVVVQHLDPEHKSNLANILQRHSVIETRVVENEASIEQNKIYVIPPATRITIKDGRLHLAKAADLHTKRMPIDEFLVSLAEEQGEDSACVILSGTGSDGTIGLQAVKGHGGLTLAQEGAEYDGMMRSAVSTGLVDVILPAEQMPAKIVEYFGQAARTRDGKGSSGLRPDAVDQLSRIAVLLRERTGHDFSGYKDNTIIRRIQRRMQVLQVDDIEEFYAKLRKEPQEIDFLFQDLLIGVTSFFRDSEQFEALEREVIPKLFENKGLDDVVRVWVPGCSTGEETYSIAMLLREQMGKNHGGPKLQVFASDIDERALEVARIGRYPASVAENVSPNRLRRFFSREDGTYRVNSELREICLFSPHNILRDPPFSRLDLISCRNLLIYLGADLQERVIPLFHYSLRDGGYLFLGSSENITRHGRLFSTIDKANRLFQKRPRTGNRLPEFPLTARVRVPQVNRVRDTNARASFEDMAERELLERYAPSYVIVNDTGDLIHSSSGTGKYLELPRGAPDHNIFTMARSGLRLNVRSALSQAIGTGRISMQKDVSVGTNGGRQTIDLIVQPLRRDGDTVYMLVFRDKGVVRPEKEPDHHEPDDDLLGGNVRQLEDELRSTKERLQTTTEELESSNEELKSANEELSSINEELQSSNEELETSKEELQSI
ncbi:MAG: CheR family methyltransferase, partial [Pararhizobium sp.]